MSDVPLNDSLKAKHPVSGEAKDEHRTVITPIIQPVQIIEGNTGFLTIKMLDEILSELRKTNKQLIEMNYYLSYLEKKKEVL